MKFKTQEPASASTKKKVTKKRNTDKTHANPYGGYGHLISSILKQLAGGYNFTINIDKNSSTMVEKIQYLIIILRASSRLLPHALERFATFFKKLIDEKIQFCEREVSLGPNFYLKKVDHYKFIRKYTLFILGKNGSVSHNYLENLVNDFFLKFQQNEIGQKGRVCIQDKKFKNSMEQIRINTDIQIDQISELTELIEVIDLESQHHQIEQNLAIQSTHLTLVEQQRNQEWFNMLNDFDIFTFGQNDMPITEIGTGLESNPQIPLDLAFMDYELSYRFSHLSLNNQLEACRKFD